MEGSNTSDDMALIDDDEDILQRCKTRKRKAYVIDSDSEESEDEEGKDDDRSTSDSSSDDESLDFTLRKYGKVNVITISFD